MKIGVAQKEGDSPSIAGGTDCFVNMFGLSGKDVFYHCPCCRYPTLATRGGYDICAVCYWEDDGQDDHDADRIRGGPNGHLSLTMAITNFALLRACEQAMVSHTRPPNIEEIRNRKNDC